MRALGMQTCTITSGWYKSMLENYVILELQQQKVINDIVWMQDGAPPHIATSVQQVLQQHFGDRIIKRNFIILWPSHSDGFLVLGLSEI